MTREQIDLDQRIETLKRIIPSDPGPGECPHAHVMIVEELSRELPELERKLAQLARGVGS